MDWKNKLHNIENKVKQQLHAKNLDTLDLYYREKQVRSSFIVLRPWNDGRAVLRRVRAVPVETGPVPVLAGTETHLRRVPQPPESRHRSLLPVLLGHQVQHLRPQKRGHQIGLRFSDHERQSGVEARVPQELLHRGGILDLIRTIPESGPNKKLNSRSSTISTAASNWKGRGGWDKGVDGIVFQYLNIGV